MRADPRDRTSRALADTYHRHSVRVGEREGEQGAGEFDGVSLAADCLCVGLCDRGGRRVGNGAALCSRGSLRA